MDVYSCGVKLANIFVAIQCCWKSLYFLFYYFCDGYSKAFCIETSADVVRFLRFNCAQLLQNIRGSLAFLLSAKYPLFRSFKLHNLNLIARPVESLMFKSRGGARGVPGGPLPPKNFAWAPQKFFRSLSESPTQTIGSSPCCKTGSSSGPPKWKCLAPPLFKRIRLLYRKCAVGAQAFESLLFNSYRIEKNTTTWWLEALSRCCLVTCPLASCKTSFWHFQ